VKRAALENKDLRVLWIGFQDRPDKIRRFAEKHGLGPVGFDEGDRASKLYGITYGAGLVFINREGTVKARVPKGLDPARLDAELKKIL
jgi:hypothetical protein